MVDELADHLSVLRGRIAVTRWPLRQPEAGIVHRDAAKSPGEVVDHLAIEEAPRRIAVEHEYGGAVAHVDIVNPGACPIKPPGFEWEKRPVGYKINLHQIPPSFESPLFRTGEWMLPISALRSRKACSRLRYGVPPSASGWPARTRPHRRRGRCLCGRSPRQPPRCWSRGGSTRRPGRGGTTGSAPR